MAVPFFCDVSVGEGALEVHLASQEHNRNTGRCDPHAIREPSVRSSSRLCTAAPASLSGDARRVLRRSLPLGRGHRRGPNLPGAAWAVAGQDGLRRGAHRRRRLLRESCSQAACDVLCELRGDPAGIKDKIAKMRTHLQKTRFENSRQRDALADLVESELASSRTRAPRCRVVYAGRGGLQGAGRARGGRHRDLQPSQVPPLQAQAAFFKGYSGYLV